MKLKSLIALTMASGLLTVAVAGTKNKSKDLKNVDFNSIRVENKLDVYITQGSTNSVNFEADQKVEDAVRTKVEDGVLKIWLAKKVKKATSRKVYITAKDLKLIAASKGAKVCSKDKLNVDKLTVDVREGSFIMMNLDANSLNCSIMDGSSAQINGEVDDSKLHICNKSNVIADKFESKNCKLDADASYAQLNVTGNLDIKASKGSEVYYVGSPAMTVNSSGETKISKKTILD